MKKLIACTSLILSVSLAFANNNISVKSKIKNVTVFLNGAQVHREASVLFKKGMYEYVFDSLSPNINTNSIQVSGKGDFIILDTKYQVDQPNYNQKKEAPKDLQELVKRIQDTIDLVSFNLEELRFKKEVLEAEKQLLTGNKSMKSDSLALLKDALAFFREKYNDINSTLITVKREEYKVNKRMSKLQAHLIKVNEKINQHINSGIALKPNHKVVVTTSSKINTSGKLKLSYMVSNASWSPSYDLRAEEINQPVALTYKVNIYQNTGENWDNIKIKLSTNNPHKSKVKPVLPTWYLNYYTPSYARTQTAVGGILKKDKSLDYAEMEEDNLSPAKSGAYYTTMTESFTNVEFNLTIPYTIKADGKSHMVAIKEEKLKTDFNYYMVPKMDQNAFLVAQLKGFEDLNLLPGSSNIYFNGTYIGQTMLNPQMTGDSLAIDFGREERIFAKRKQLKIDEKGKLLGTDKVKKYKYEILVKNNLVAPIDLIVEENYPIPTNKEIKVELTNNGKAKVTKETGMLVWKFNLASKTAKKLNFGYEVKHPKDKYLALN